MYSHVSQDADLSSLSQMDTFLGVRFGPSTIFDVAFSAQHVCHSGWDYRVEKLQGQAGEIVWP